MTNTTMTMEETVTATFRGEYAALAEGCTSDEERANALETARERASALVPDGRFGSFDDEELTFREDPTSNT